MIVVTLPIVLDGRRQGNLSFSGRKHLGGAVSLSGIEPLLCRVELPRNLDTRGRRVAMQAAVMPTPISTVVKIAMSVVFPILRR